MGEYSYQTALLFDAGGGGFNFIFEGPGSGTLTDGESDGTFEFPDPLTPSGTTAAGTFFGTIQVPLNAGGTVTAVVINFNSGSGADVYLPVGTNASDVTLTFFTEADLNQSDFSAPCFLSGTRITTPDGDVPVEELQIGQMLRTHDGRDVAVKWVGQKAVSTLFGPAEQLSPVRIRAGALGKGLPLRDLLVTADHGMLVGDLLCNAGALVNGTTITLEPLGAFGEAYTVYHVETEDHVVILAEGASSETFIDYTGRQAFDNFESYVALYGGTPPIAEMPMPRVSSARALPADLRARLSLTSAAA